MARHPLQYFVREGHPERGGNEKNPNWILENMWRGERGKDSGEDHAAAIKQKRERFTLLRAVLLVIKQSHENEMSACLWCWSHVLEVNVIVIQKKKERKTINKKRL